MDNLDNRKQREFESLVIEHHVRVRAFVRSLGVEPDWVDDIAQEAFLTAYRRWDSLDQSRDSGKWLRGIAANIVRNEIRKDARRRRILHSELTGILARRQEQVGARREPVAISAIQDCLGKLPPGSREIVQSRYRDGETASQLAQRLGLTAAGVRQKLVRIRRKVKECVEARVARGEV